MNEIHHSLAKRPDRDLLLYEQDLTIGDEYHVRVFVWPTLPPFLEFTKQEEGVIGFYTYPEIYVSDATKDEERLVTPGDIGYIHLVFREFGAGVFAHELQHFIQMYIDLFQVEPCGEDWEDVAYIAGDITTIFWRDYLKRRKFEFIKYTIRNIIKRMKR